jgi:outer membrane protein OmpA-like peptidoglycan-associated protein
MVVEHGLDAVSYQYGAPATKIDFRGTVLLSDGKGEAKVQSRRGGTEVEAKFENIPAPTRFGREYLTYVLWAISPEGGTRNLGEIIPDTSNRSQLRVTTDLQTFGMIVTAEPYSNVQQPSDVVVLENHVRTDTAGQVRQIQPKAELMPRGQYTFQVPSEPPPNGAKPPKKVSMDQYEAILQVYQAQNAIAIARAADAERYAPDSLAAAERALGEAQRLQAKKAKSNQIIQNAREAAQDADDARSISERRKQDEEHGAPPSRPAAQPQAAPPTRDEANRETREFEFRSHMREMLANSFLSQNTPDGTMITIPDDAFNGNSLLPNVSQKFGSVASLLATRPSLHVNISAYTDSTGSELESWERAQAVRNALVGSGVAENRINIRGYGAKDNRRVEVLISDLR